MARSLRINVANGIYHLTARGNRRQLIFLGDDDRRRFLALLDQVAARLGWRCHAYCLMPNHYHLVIETAAPDLSVGMHRLNSGYAHWFNQRHDLDGHLFQSRFHSVLVESQWHLVELCRYVALNPVRAGLCAHPAAWSWSSYRAVLGARAMLRCFTADLVLGLFGRDRERARSAFRRFVLEGSARPKVAA